VRAPVALLYGRAKERPSGYVDDFLAVGKIDGEFIEIPDAEFERLRKKWANKQPIRGLGDLVWWALRWLPAKWKPKNCKCEARRAWLNKAFPFN
jgi:hypothetical protein